MVFNHRNEQKNQKSIGCHEVNARTHKLNDSEHVKMVMCQAKQSIDFDFTAMLITMGANGELCQSNRFK